MSNNRAGSVFAHGLNGDQFAQVGRVIMNWGAADNAIGYCLNLLYGISDPPAQLELLGSLDIKKKADLLRKASGRASLSGEAHSLAVEIQKVVALWGADRNALAHGFGILDNSDVMLSSAKKQDARSLELLDQFEDRSDYVLNIALRLNNILAGVQWNPFGPLPDRPK